jgi:hypothetical protein
MHITVSPESGLARMIRPSPQVVPAFPISGQGPDLARRTVPAGVDPARAQGAIDRERQVLPRELARISNIGKLFQDAHDLKERIFLIFPIDRDNEPLKIGVLISLDPTRPGLRRREPAGSDRSQEGGASGAPHLTPRLFESVRPIPGSRNRSFRSRDGARTRRDEGPVVVGADEPRTVHDCPRQGHLRRQGRPLARRVGAVRPAPGSPACSTHTESPFPFNQGDQ